MEKQIPILTLQEIQEGSEKVREACKLWGCFRLTNHGISTNLMAEMQSIGKAILDQHTVTNNANNDVESKSRTNTYFKSYPLFKSVRLNECSNLKVSPQEREIIHTYTKALDKLGSYITSKIASNMGEPKEDMKEWPKVLRLSKYTFDEETIIGSSGLGVHTDPGFLTIVQDDPIVCGLQVMDPHGSFIPVHPLADAFLVNMGDIAALWSNGKLRNVQHEVRCKEPMMRFSIVTFIYPPADKVIEPQACFLEVGEQPRYPPITNSQYKEFRDSKRLLAGEALDSICLTK